jgi:hypothetical protein
MIVAWWVMTATWTTISHVSWQFELFELSADLIIGGFHWSSEMEM